jgi:hypothetical protein
MYDAGTGIVAPGDQRQSDDEERPGDSHTSL